MHPNITKCLLRNELLSPNKTNIRGIYLAKKLDWICVLNAVSQCRNGSWRLQQNNSTFLRKKLSSPRNSVLSQCADFPGPGLLQSAIKSGLHLGCDPWQAKQIHYAPNEMTTTKKLRFTNVSSVSLKWQLFLGSLTIRNKYSAAALYSGDSDKGMRLGAQDAVSDRLILS